MRPVGLLWALACLQIGAVVTGFVPPSANTNVRRPAAPAARAAARAGAEGDGAVTPPSSSRPPVVAVIGHPGSGQTTFASRLAKECGARLMGVAEEGILEELRTRIMEGKGKVSMPQAMTEAVAGRIAKACREGQAKALVLDGWPRGPYQLERLRAAGGDVDRAVFLDTGEEKEDPQLVALREALGEGTGAAMVVNEGAIDQVYGQVKAALAPAIEKQRPPASTPAAIAAAPAPAPAPAASPSKASSAKKEQTSESAEPLMFGGLLLTGSPAAALRRAGIKQPTEVQEVALPRITRGDDVLIHEETGSGKTLAYLLPLLQGLDLSVPRQVMVVAPTRELAVQVGRVANELLSHDSGGKKPVALLIEDSGSGAGGDAPSSSTAQALGSIEAPVLVGTAKVIWGEMQRCNGTEAGRRPRGEAGNEKGAKAVRAALKNLRAVVIDEIDRCIAPLSAYATLKDKRQKARHPKPATLILEEIYQRQRMGPQLVGASATIGRPLRRELARCMGVDPKFDGPIVLRADRAAAKVEEGGRAVGIPEGIQHFYVAVPEDDMQLKLMAARAYLLEREPKHPLVFVPSDTPVSEVVGRMKRLLRGTDFEVTPLHEAMGFAFNRDNIVRKGGRPKKLDPEEEAAAAKRERPDLLTVEDQVARSLASTTTGAGSSANAGPAPILVTSVETARGLDFGGVCDCVLILGRVNTPDDYQHVAGRTGRRRTITFGTGKEQQQQRGRKKTAEDGGVAVSIISQADVRKLSAYESMLGIRFARDRLEELEDWDANDWGYQ